jgi:hypothetical protein
MISLLHRSRLRLLVMIALLAIACPGCALGPCVLERTRLRYNEAVKTTTEEQLLLNVVRLRYIDNFASLAITDIVDQQELSASAQELPFFSSGGNAIYRFIMLPQAMFSGASRPTLSFTPQDDEDFTRRLFFQPRLDIIASLAHTTWPVSTDFRVLLDAVNRVPNAKRVGGAQVPPIYAEFLTGIRALQRLEDRELMVLDTEEHADKVSTPVKGDLGTLAAALDAAKSGMEYRKDDQGRWTAVRRSIHHYMHFGDVEGDPDFLTFCECFHLNPRLRKFELTSGEVDPFLANVPKEGLDVLDLDTRCFFQVLLFVANGVHVPPEHVTKGIAPVIIGPDGLSFDWDPVLEGLFKVCWAKGKKPPPCAHVAVCYKGYWFYIDELDQETKATFSLLVELSRLELGSKKAPASPALALPLNQ